MRILRIAIVFVLLSTYLTGQSQGDTESPTIPGNLTSHDITSSGVRLTWDESTDIVGVVGYIIFNGEDSLTSLSGLEHIFIDLEALTDYVFTVLAYDAAGNRSGASNPVNVRTLEPPDITVPSVPANLTPHDVTMTSIRLTWDESTDNIGVASYIIYQGTDSIAQVNTLEYTINNLLPATRYFFSVKAKDTAGNKSESSNVIDTVTSKDILSPSIPTGLASHDITTTSVRLTWNSSTDNIKVTGYIVYSEGDSLTTVGTTEFIVTGLTPSTNYNFSIKAVDAAGNKSGSTDAISITTLIPPDVTAPSAPGNLTPHNITYTSIRLTWNASTDYVGVTGYIVYQGNDSIGQVTNLEFTVNNLQSDARYLFKVIAKDAAGNKSEFSNIIDTVTVKDVVVPSIPAALTAHDTTTTSVRLTWNPSTDNFSSVSYIVYSGTDSIASVTNVQYTVTGLTPATTYSFSVRAKDAAGNKSAQSIAVSVKTLATADVVNPSVPLNLSADNITVSSLRIKWDASTDNVGVTSYVIYRGNDLITTISALEYTLTGLLPATKYIFYIRAKDAAGNTSAPGMIEITTASDITSPSAPANLKGSDITISSVRLTWDASTDNVSVASYIVYRGNDSITTVNSLIYTVNGLSVGSVYSFSVRAKDAAGNKSAASTISITTSSDITPPSAPANLKGNNITSSSVRLTWNTSTDNVGVTGYIVFRGADSLTTISETEYTVTGLTVSTNYSFTVKARDAGGNKSLSSNIVNILTLGPPDVQSPSAPANLISFKITATSVDLSWSASTDNVGVTGYVVYSGSDSLTEVTGLECTVNGLTPNTRYLLNIKAIDAAGNLSLSSNIVSFKTHIVPDTDRPTAPTSLTAHDASDTSIRLTWVAATDNIKVTGYRIYANHIIVTTTNLTDYLLTGLKPDSTYSLYIIAYDAAANLSDTSNVVEITTIHGIDVMPPSIPEGLTIYNLTSEQISFRWDPSTDNEELLGYRVYVNEELMTTTSLTEFSLIDLIPNIIYSFYIRAVDVNGNISGSSIKISASTNGEVVIVTGVGDKSPLTFNLVTFLIGENKLKVKIPLEIQNIEKVEIYNLSGRLIYSSNSIQEDQLINMDQADPFKGVYILVLTNRNFIVSKKFIY